MFQFFYPQTHLHHPLSSTFYCSDWYQFHICVSNLKIEIDFEIGFDFEVLQLLCKWWFWWIKVVMVRKGDNEDGGGACDGNCRVYGYGGDGDGDCGVKVQLE